jgi:eukaryotic-like serine/threonine-protein kinase
LSPEIDSSFLELQGGLLGRYSIERELGRGGTGVVYLAREVRLDRLVALKVLRPDQGPEARARFLQEARTAARLSHPNIVPILAIEECGQFVFFTMPYIAGGTVGERVRSRGPFLPIDAVRILRDIAWALEYSHGHGIIHRDIKPDNILIERETQRTLVADFGIAATTDTLGGGAPVTGTPAFMSPEQILGQDGDVRSDLYSLAAVAYYLLSGQTPFSAATAEAQLLAHLNQQPSSLGEIASHVPEALAAVIMRGLSKDMDQRPSSAAAFAEELSTWLGEQHRPVPAGVARFLRQLRDSRPVALLYTTVCGLLLVIQMVLALKEPWRLEVVIEYGLLFALPPLVILLARVRGLIAQGHTRADLVQALHGAADREEQEARQTPPRGLPWKRVALRWSIIVALGSALVWLPSVWYYAGMLFLVNLVSVACVVVLGDQVRTVGRERRRAWFWNGRVGQWLFSVAGFGVRRRLSADATGHHTEVAIGFSAMSLYDRLPAATRGELGDVPQIVESLEADARRVRERRRDLRELRARTTNPDLSARLSLADERLARRHADVLTALESIRLNLLRLHVGSIKIEGFTTDLGNAAQLAQRLTDLAEAHDDVNRLLNSTPSLKAG